MLSKREPYQENPNIGGKKSLSTKITEIVKHFNGKGIKEKDARAFSYSSAYFELAARLAIISIENERFRRKDPVQAQISLVAQIDALIERCTKSAEASKNTDKFLAYIIYSFAAQLAKAQEQNRLARELEFECIMNREEAGRIVRH